MKRQSAIAAALIYALSVSFSPRSSGEPLQPIWRELAPMPTARLEAWAGHLSGSLYVVGGFVPGPQGGFGATNAVERYLPTEDRWEVLAPFPASPPLTHIGIAQASGCLFAIGGLDSQFGPADTVFRYDPNSDSWAQVAPLPEPRGAFGVTVVDEKIYCSGGFPPESRGRDFDVYDPVLDEWSPLPDLPRDRESHVALNLDGRIYLFGGRVRSLTAFVPETDFYDPLTQEWDSGPPIPTPRGGLAGGVIENRAYLFGGEGSRSQTRPEGVYSQVERYDPETNLWAELPPMPRPRHGMIGVSLNNSIFLPGGGAVVGFSISNVLDVFTLLPHRNTSSFWRSF